MSVEPEAAFVPLQTKLFIPDIRSDIVARPRLLDRMNQGASRKLTLVSAPAGFGKTTLIACWLHQREQRAVWLSLDELDNQLIRLVNYVIAGFRALDPQAMAKTAELVENSTTVLLEHLVQSLVVDLLDFGHPVHLVFDDYHIIHDHEIHQLLIRLIAVQPANLHIIVATRSDPLLPLPKLRVSDDMVEVRVMDLRFSPQEVSEYITLSMGETLNSEIVDSTIVHEVTRSTEGWIAGLRLLVLALQSHESESPLAERVAGRTHDFAIDYLISEVLEYQPEHVRRFLLVSSVVDRFHVDLMAHLTGEGPEESQTTLSAIIGADLFVIRLDRDHHWYRYHHLFQAALRQRMVAEYSPQEVAKLHLRASSWFAERGLISEALHYALAAQDLDQAVALVEANSHNYLNGIERRQLEEWLAKLPDGEIWRRPALLTAKAWLFYRHWRIDELEPLLDQLTHIVASESSQLSDEQRSSVLGHVFTLRTCVETLTTANADHIITTSLAALEALPASEQGGRATALGYQAIALQLRGDQGQAFDLLESALVDPSPSAPAKVQLYLSLCVLCERIGDFPRMERAVRRFLSLDSNGISDNSGANWMAGRLTYEWNQLDRAIEHFSATVARQHSTNFLAAATSMMGIVRIHMLRNELDEAQALLDHALAECNRLGNTVLYPLIESLRAELWIKTGQPQRARTWVQSIEPSTLPIGPTLTDSLLENWSRLCLLLGQSGQEIDDLLETVHIRLQCALETAASTRSPYRDLRSCLLLSACELAMGDRRAAEKRLSMLLPLIRSGQLVRSVLDLGVGLEPLLNRYELHGALASELTAGRRTQHASRPASGSVGRPSRSDSLDLTRREEEILVLMQKGYTNQEIADDLIISLYTVKRHATNIYNKMAVSNRRQAVRAAIEAGVLRAAW